MRIVALLLAASTFSGCVLWRADVVPPGGIIFSAYSAPLTLDHEGATARPTLHGTASSYFVREPIVTGFSVSAGDVSLEQACKDAGIKRLAYADYKITMVLATFGIFTVNAYGEPEPEKPTPPEQAQEPGT